VIDEHEVSGRVTRLCQRARHCDRTIVYSRDRSEDTMVVQGSTECLAEFGCDSTLTIPAEPGALVPKATLLCRPNSHPFQDRTLVLDQPVKVGRSVARARPVQNNAIFDCKVLSRNHALLWYENGKFFLQDTKSSNGTFVNNQRLSKGSEESPPREVCSGDILQFGVDVMENSRKVTHGCIIATLRLFLPDGKEAKASPTIVNTATGTSIPTQDLYQLNQYIQESLAREQLLENKLLALHGLVGETEGASASGWKALMDEDRLLTRVEILESQLTTYGKNMTEDKLREETKRLMEEKEAYQNTAKDTLKKLVDEKLEALKKLKEVEKTLRNMEDEYTSLRQLYDKGMEENKKLSEKITTINTELVELTKKQRAAEEFEASVVGENENVIKKESPYIEDSEGCLDDSLTENGPLTTGMNGKIDIEDIKFEKNGIDMGGSTDSLDGTKPDGVEGNEKALELSKVEKEMQKLKCVVEELHKLKSKTDNEILNLKLNLEETKNENSTILQELENTRNKLVDADEVVESKNILVQNLLSKLEEYSHRPSPSSPLSPSPPSPISPLADTPPKVTPPPEAARDTTTTSAISDSSAIHSESQDVRDLTLKCTSLQQQIEALEKTNSLLKDQLSNRESGLSNISTKEDLSKLKPSKKESDILNASSSSDVMANVSDDVADEVNSDVSLLEMSLSEAEEKIAGLLQLKEKLVVVQADNSRLEEDVSGLEEELSTLSSAARFITACTMVPIIVILIAIVIAFFPSVSSLFGTKDF